MKLLILAAILTLSQAQDDYCFGRDTERTQTRQFGTKTAYQIIKGTNIDKQYLVPGCEPKKIWIYHRHGTRLPSADTIKKAHRLEELRDVIVKNYQVKKLRSSTEINPLCQEDLFALRMWKWNSNITLDKAEFLTNQGYEDLRGTAKLYQRYYGSVLTRNYNDTYYLFRHTDRQRTQESFKAFAEGLFGSNNAVVPESIPEEDLLLRPDDYCSAFQTQNYKGAGSEFEKYTKSHLWNNTLTDISRRLGFDYTLATDDIELMFDMCRYEQAWQVDRTSVWCAAFLPEQITIFEYSEDLKYYYKSGYGFDDNLRLNCRAVKDMLTHLNSPASPHVVAYFGHSTGVQTLIAALGISRDDIKLTADNYNSLANRRWKTSNIDPFASNFLAVKYECLSDAYDKEKVVFFLNQYAVQLDWCNVGLCNWPEVQKHYENYANANCDDYYCRSSAAIISKGASLTVLVTAIIYLINH